MTQKIIIVIVIAFLIRLIGISNPPIEKSHNWRQTFTNMVARNFDHTGIMNPEVDQEGGKKVAMEFPVFSYAIYILNSVFGYSHWYGRIFNLFISSIGLFYFFKLIKRIFNENLAFYSTIILTFSIFFAFSRKIMPDTFSIALTIIGVYNFIIYIRDKHQLSHLLAGIFFTLMGVLSKIPSLIIIAFLVLVIVDRNQSFKYKMIVLITGLAPIAVLTYWWYWIWNTEVLQNGAVQLIFTPDFMTGLHLTKEHLAGVLEKFYFSGLCSYVAFAFFLIGLVMAFIRKQGSLILLFVFSSCLFFGFIIKGAYFFYFHTYYIIPFVPVMALFAGYGITLLYDRNKKAGIGIICIIILESILNQQHDFFNPPELKYKLQLTSLVDRYVAKDQKVVLNSGPNPQQLYFSNRKGWLIDEPPMITKNIIDSITDQSPIVIIDRHIQTNYPTTEFTNLFTNEDYILLKEIK